jgi:hydrogenase maturation protein HypF
MLAYTPLHHLLLRAVDGPLVATSGNRSEEPICVDRGEARERLTGVADLLLVHDRPIERHVDDSVAWRVRGETRLLRRARGFAPLPVRVPRPLPPVLAVGGHLKNVVALARGREVFLSQHIGDLETAESQAAFRRVVEDFLRLYRSRPGVVAHDLHPEYASTLRAREWARDGWPGDGHGGDPPAAVAVQHHHAHLVSCLAEHGVEGPALGIVWDGAGHGPDGTVWGGEFLLGDAAGYRRLGHLHPFRLPGGDAAARAPDRVAAALLRELDPEGWEASAARWTGLGGAELPLLRTMLEGGVRSPVTTSAGRLFDGVAALLGLRSRTSFEGEAAMALEAAAGPDPGAGYPFGLRETDGGDGHLVLDWRPALRELLRDRERGVEVSTASARFHRGLADAAVELAARLGPPTVALTGGCFQNRRLLERCAAALEERGLRPLLHREVPPNDGGLALGQAVVAAERTAATERTGSSAGPRARANDTSTTQRRH